MTVTFEGGQLSSDCGGFLLKAAEGRLQLISRMASCISDARDIKITNHGAKPRLQLGFDLKPTEAGNEKTNCL